MATTQYAFRSIYRHGFLRVAVAAPHVAIADPAENAARTLELAAAADREGAGAALFPELGLTGYAIDDLLLQSAVLSAARGAIETLRAASAELAPLIVVGAPLEVAGRLYNCGVALHRGRVLGVTPKTYLPNYREFYEARHFAPADPNGPAEIRLGAELVPFGTDLLFEFEDVPGAAAHVEICEDVWAPEPPSGRAALAGATVLLNLSASNVTIGKSAFRRALCEVQSARCVAGYVYSAAGRGESTTDLAWDGHAMIYENGRLLAESARFAEAPQLTFADLDVERLTLERARTGTFGANAARARPEARRVPLRLDPPAGDIGLRRPLERFPFVPNAPEQLDALCYEAFNIQVAGLRQRLEGAGVRKLVIGVSGGLDSTQALLVAVRAFDALGWPRTDVLAYTLPAFATSDATKSNAWTLMRALGVSAEEIDLTEACRQMLRDIGHPAADGAAQYDVAYENVQAGARTSLLFRLANHHGALVLGTGDLSELALGWCTYGVGDHMSHYNVNASVPKTLIQHLIRWCAATGTFGAETPAVLQAILGTEISPELVPGSGEGGGPAQRTEDFVGPYALQDFTLYYATRYGLAPSKIAFLAMHAWGDATAGVWPPNMAAEERRSYDLPTIKAWLRVFVKRFYQTSQFKRSALPNGPKVASGGSLSPRGDWRAPSDGSAALWLAELEANVPDEAAVADGAASPAPRREPRGSGRGGGSSRPRRPR